MHCQRQLLHVRWYDFVPNSDISATTQLPCISDVIACRRSGLFGHVARLDCGVPARDALDCTIARRSERRPPAGWKRPPGRPRQTWITQIGDGTPSGVIREFNRASRRGHTRSALRSSDGQAFWRKEGRKVGWSCFLMSVAHIYVDIYGLAIPAPRRFATLNLHLCMRLDCHRINFRLRLFCCRFPVMQTRVASYRVCV